MVANVSDVPAASGSGRATDDATTAGTDGFLQELLGIVGMTPAMTPPPAQAGAAAASAAGTSTSEVGDVMSGNAKANAAALRTIPAWLSTAVDETAIPVANDASATSNTIATTAASSQAPLTPDILNALPAPVENPRAVKEAQLPSNEVVAQTTSSSISSATAEVSSLPSTATSVVSSADAATKTSSATPAIDIDNLLASMSRFDKPPRASKNSGSTAAPEVTTTGVKTETNAANDLPAALGVAAQPHAKPEKLFEEALTQDKADATAPDTKEADAFSTQFSSLHSNQVASRDAQEIPTRQLHARLGTPEWKDQLGTQLNWMVDNGKHSASLKLNPEHLGPVEVRIDVNQNQTSVWFSASNADTRTALEQALPRLRELMASNGMSLSDAGVFREPPREQRGSSNGSQNDSRGIASGGFGSGDSGEEVVAAVRRRSTLLDTYA